MKRLKYLVVMLIVSMLIVPVSAQESNDFYTKADDNVTVSEDVEGSSFIAGENVELSSSVNGIGFLFGNNITVNNEVEYLITAGNVITINGNVKKDVILAGNIINISGESIIGRDVIIAANEVNISGTINRNIKILASKVNFKKAQVNGNVDLSVGTIYIDENTKVAGKLNYNDDAEQKIESKEIGSITTYESDDSTISFKDTILDNAIAYASMLLIFLVLAFIAPKMFEKINKDMNKSDVSTPFKLFVVGFFSLILIPFVSILLFASVIGVSLGLLLLVLFIIAICLVNVFVSYIVGRLVLTKLLKKDDNVLLSGFIGMIILYILSLIPYINSIISFISLFVGLGIIVTLIMPKKVKE